ncbi:MAG: hypothetical protein IT316_10595 [Anaerolineales bacterium]|nr:hypothetical protein [Anaerolineales bacterium]
MDEPKSPLPPLSLPFALQPNESSADANKLAAPLRAGQTCPACGRAELEYDGLLNLVCPQCGFSGGAGCHT